MNNILRPPFVKRPEQSTTTHGRGDGGGIDLHDVHGRVSAIEAHLQHLATKSDINGVKVWVLSGVVAAFVIALTLLGWDDIKALLKSN